LHISTGMPRRARGREARRRMASSPPRLAGYCPAQGEPQVAEPASGDQANRACCSTTDQVERRCTKIAASGFELIETTGIFLKTRHAFQASVAAAPQTNRAPARTFLRS
jgi:hypothetical protein